uniref:Uncharacterized protein DKFZp434B061-like isoform X1 n=1 Tax=Tursiops truncatus TaxID=9739 RepID=A0A6J3QQ67_TURTR|nr:uncharacterized protein DKFZp434B061-like isoform X1 [Tursiops truncatus]
MQRTLSPDSDAGVSPGPQPPLGLHTTPHPSAGETSSSQDLPRASARGGTSSPSPPRFPRPQPYLLAAEAMANQPHPPASPLRRWAGAGRSEKPSRSWHLSSRTSRTCGVRQQVHSPPGGRGTRAPRAVNVRLASWTATPRRNLIQRASLWFPASYREVQSPRAASLTGFTGLRPGGDQRPPPPSPASSAPAAAPASANRSSPASPPRRAGRHAAAANQWRG